MKGDLKEIFDEYKSGICRRMSVSISYFGFVYSYITYNNTLTCLLFSSPVPSTNLPTAHPSFLPLLQHLLRRDSRKPRHDLEILLLAHLLVAAADLRQDLEIVNVEGRRERVEELCLRVRRVRERVRRPDRHRHVVADVGVVVSAVRSVESHHALRHEEGLVVHFVPVCWGAGGVGRECEFCRAYAVVWVVVSV